MIINKVVANMQLLYSAKMWLKKSETPLAKNSMTMINRIRFIECPSVGIIHRPIYLAHLLMSNSIKNFTRFAYWTPVFKSRLSSVGKNFYLYSGMPLVLGQLAISVGDNVRMSGISTLCGRSSGLTKPELCIGNNVDIGWQNSINVGSKITIGDNVRLAGKVFLAGFPGHPLDAKERAQGLPENEDQVGDIVLERDVWLATGVTVMAGVTIGRGTVVCAGSVVTKDLPAGVIAGGMPAKVIKLIGEQ
jgi:acetyltransferase-like isoleucine patch superfamily enzyme